MLRAREESPWRKILFSWPTFLVLLVIAVLLSRSVYSLYTRERATAQLLSDRRAELADVEARAAIIESKLKNLDTPRGVEEEVRSRFEVAKPGERVIVIVDQNGDASSSAVTELGFWSRVRAFFGF